MLALSNIEQLFHIKLRIFGEHSRNKMFMGFFSWFREQKHVLFKSFSIFVDFWGKLQQNNQAADEPFVWGHLGLDDEAECGADEDRPGARVPANSLRTVDNHYWSKPLLMQYI